MPVNPCGHVLRSTIINTKRGKTAWSDSISHYNRLSVFLLFACLCPGSEPPFFFVILLMLFYGIRLDVKVLLRGYFCEIKIKVILLFGIIRINLRYCLEYEPFNGITVFQVNNRQLKPVRPRKKRRGSLFRKIVKALPRSLSVKKIEVAGEIGRRDDAFLSVLICGIVSVFMDALFRFILNVLIKVKRSENCVINIFPAPNRSTFNLNMAGIVRVNLIKLFLNVFIRTDKAE